MHVEQQRGKIQPLPMEASLDNLNHLRRCYLP